MESYMYDFKVKSNLITFRGENLISIAPSGNTSREVADHLILVICDLLNRYASKDDVRIDEEFN